MNQPISIARSYNFRASNDQIIKEKKTYDLARLRQEIAVADGYDKRLYMPLSVDSLDQALAGGLTLGRVHLLMGAMQAHGAVSGFAMALLDLLQNHTQQTSPKQASNRPTAVINDAGLIVWCPASQRNGAGMLYGHGLAAAGLDPARLLIVDTPNPSRRLAALDDILRTEGLAAVVMEYDGVQKSADYWMRLARRAQLAAEDSGTTSFLLGAPIGVAGFETAWQIKPAADLDRWSHSALVQRSVWDLTLQRARGGRPHKCRVVWQAGLGQLQACHHSIMANGKPVQAELPIADLSASKWQAQALVR